MTLTPSQVHTASMAAAEAIAHLAETEQFRHWLMSGRGETAPSFLLQKMIGFAVAEPKVFKVSWDLGGGLAERFASMRDPEDTQPFTSSVGPASASELRRTSRKGNWYED